MRIQRSSSPKEYHTLGSFKPAFLRGQDRRQLGRTLMIVSAALGLVLLIWMSVCMRMGSVLPRLRPAAGRGPVDVPARANGLSTLRLDLDLEAYQALGMQRQRALQAGILLPAGVHWVPAQIRLEGRTTPVRVRLAGSEPDGSSPIDHWAPDKWSLEVEVEGDKKIHGARSFSLLSPAARGYLNAWLYAEARRRAGIPAPVYDYVNLALNGEGWGVYALEVKPLEGSSALDAERLGRSLAHADLWGARLPGTEHRPRHLAARDATIVGPASSAGPAEDAGPSVNAAYLLEAARISQPEYLRVLRRVYSRAFRRYHDALAAEFFPAYLQAPWDALAERQQMLSTALQAGEFAPGGSSTQEADTPTLPDVAALLLDEPPVLNLIPAPSVEEVLDHHPFLRAARQPGFLEVAPGTWHVEGDLVLPEGVGLRASEAVTLHFRDAGLVVRGPLILDGPEGEGIRLLPEGDRWGGVLVYDVDAEAQSMLRNVEIRGTRGIRRDEWRTSGGLTFVGTPLRFDRCRVLDSDARAAVHIVGAPFEWTDSELGAASGDLLWVEGARGEIARSAFHDAPGAALRLVGSEVQVWGVSLLRVQGEALSARLGSAVRALGIRAREVGIAVAAVDGAFVSLHDVRVGRAERAGLVAYQAGGGPATIEASEVMFEDSSQPALVQEGSRVTIDGLPVETQALEATDLHPQPQVSPPLEPLHVRFGPSIWLIGYQLTTPERAPGETVEVILYWRAFAYLDRQYTVFMHLLDTSGEWVTGWDMMPRYNTYPTTDWPVATLIDDVRILPLPSDLPPGTYTVALGMYDWGTGERLPAYTREGQAIPNQAVILEEGVEVK